VKEHAIGPRGKKKPRKKTWATDERRLELHTPAEWRGRKAKTITYEEVTALHAKIGAKTPYEVIRFIDLLRVMFRLARLWRMAPEGSGNPAAGVEKFKEHERKRWGRPAELAAIVKAIDWETNLYARGALWIYILSGGRKREVLDSKRANVDWERGQLRLPDTKAGEKQFLTLSAPALAILQALPVQDEKNPYIFQGSKKGRPLINVDKAWRRIRDRATVTLWAEADDKVAELVAGLTRDLGREPKAEEVEDVAGEKITLQGDIRDLTIHDLRRTTGSIGGNARAVAAPDARACWPGS
jgi:integrase